MELLPKKFIFCVKLIADWLLNSGGNVEYCLEERLLTHLENTYTKQIVIFTYCWFMHIKMCLLGQCRS